MKKKSSKNYKTISVSKFSNKYFDDIQKILEIIKNIDNNIKLDIDCQYIDLKQVLISYYLLFLIFIKEITHKNQEYLNTLKKDYYFNQIATNQKISEYHKEKEIIERETDIIINDINIRTRLKKSQIQKIELVIDNCCHNLKEAFMNISVNDFNMLPKEVLEHYDKSILKEHYLLYCTFISFDTIENIKQYLKYKCQVNFSLDKKSHNYTIYLSNKTQVNKLKSTLLKKIAVEILFFDTLFSYNVTQIPTYNIYYTDLKKKLPQNNDIKKTKKTRKIKNQEVLFRPINVNTAVTDNQSNIVIWRKEELLKSILHEAIHFYKLDTKSNIVNNQIKEFILKKFKINKKSYFHIAEAFTELNANIINSIFNLYYLKPNLLNKSSLENSFLKIMMDEINFSIKQTAKIFKLCNYKYPIDFLRTKTNSRSKTNHKSIKQLTDVTSYHIIKSIFLFNIESIYSLNYKDNQNKEGPIKLLIALNFGHLNNKNQDNIKLFILEIKKIINNSFKKSNNWSKEVQRVLNKKLSLKKDNTMRMTYFNND